MDDRYLLISADCHAGPESGHYREYIDPEFREAYEEYLVNVAGMRGLLAGNQGGRNQFVDRFLAETGDAGMPTNYPCEGCPSTGSATPAPSAL